MRIRGFAVAMAHVLLTGTAVLAANALFERWLPPAQEDRLGRKMKEVLDLSGEIDTLFVGSSRPYRHLDPRVFDAVFARHGERRFSYNLGIPMTRMLEVDYLVRWLLDHRLPKLRWLIIEAESNPLRTFPENLLTTREIRIHDPVFMAILGRQLWQRRETRTAAVLELALHARPFLYNLVHVGRGSDAVQALFRGSRHDWSAGHRGFFPLDEEVRRRPGRDPEREREEEIRQERLHERLPRYEAALERLMQSSPAGKLTDEAEVELMARLEQRLAPHGIRTVYLLSPQPHRRPNVVWAHEEGIIPRLLRFDDPKQYPRLFAPELRFDRHHLNEEGARLFTEMVASRLVESP